MANRIYELTCDNGQVIELCIVDDNATIEEEISKHEALFPKSPCIGWSEPRPTKVISWNKIS